jgi:hypothetical protein
VALFVVLPSIFFLVGARFLKDKVGRAGIEKVIENAVEKETGKKVDIDSDKNSVTIKGENGEEASISTNDGQTLPSDFPAVIPVYEPQTIVSTLKNNKKDKSGWYITAKTADNQSKVATFFSNAFKTNGWTISNEASYGGTQTFTAESSAYKVVIIITAPNSTNNQTIVTYTVSSN